MSFVFGTDFITSKPISSSPLVTIKALGAFKRQSFIKVTFTRSILIPLLVASSKT